MEQTMDIDEVAFSKLQIRQSNLKEEPLKVITSLIPPPTTEASADAMENTDGEGLSEAEKRLQRGEEQYELYNRIYVGQLSDDEESNMDTNGSTYTYFGYSHEHS